MVETYYTPAQLARRWKVHRQQIHRWIAEQRLRKTLIAGQPFIRGADAIRPEPNKRGPKPDKSGKKRRENQASS